MTTATLLGSTTPRLWTRPAVTGPPGPCVCGECALSPETSLGFSVIAFGEMTGTPLLKWQQFLVVHGMELRPDNLPRFRTVLALVARQAGKTTLLKVIAGWWMTVAIVPLILGISTKLSTAAEAWRGCLDLLRSDPDLDQMVAEVRRANGQECITTTDGARYMIAASNDDAGRGLTVHRLILDEVRQQRTWATWSASVKAMTAVADAQAWCITNAGDDDSVVLNALREQALEQMQQDDPVDPIGLFEWSAPDGCAIDDREAWAQANPSLGYIVTEAAIRSALVTDPEPVFRVEVLCQRVRSMSPAVTGGAWEGCFEPGDLGELRSRVALCFDVSLDGQHATVIAAAVQDDGRVRVEPVHAWSGPSCMADLERELPALVAKVKPSRAGWLPSGPAAALAASMAKRPGWPPRGVALDAIRGDVPATCMGLAKEIEAGTLVHSADPLLTAHVTTAERKSQGDRWVFVRKGAGHCDAAYAAAGAVYLARQIPPRRATRIIVAA